MAASFFLEGQVSTPLSTLVAGASSLWRGTGVRATVLYSDCKATPVIPARIANVLSTEQRINLESPCGQQPFWNVTLVSVPLAPLSQLCGLNALFALQPKSPDFAVELSCACLNWKHRFAQFGLPRLRDIGRRSSCFGIGQPSYSHPFGPMKMGQSAESLVKPKAYTSGVPRLLAILVPLILTVAVQAQRSIATFQGHAAVRGHSEFVGLAQFFKWHLPTAGPSKLVFPEPFSPASWPPRWRAFRTFSQSTTRFGTSKPRSNEQLSLHFRQLIKNVMAAVN